MESSATEKYRADELSSQCFDTFIEMRRKDELCDFNLRLYDHEISAHRVVLSATMPYFRRQFEKDPNTKKITPPAGIAFCALGSLVDFAYTHQIEITALSVDNILSAACALEVDFVTEACTKFLTKHLCAENALATWELANRLGCFDLKANVDNFICRSFEAVATTPNFLNVSFKHLKTLTARGDLQASSEEKIYEFVMEWTKEKLYERRSHLLTILGNVRLELLSRSYFSKNVETESLIVLSDPCKELVKKAKKAQSSPKTERNVSVSRTYLQEGNPSPKEGVPPGLYFVTEESSLVMQHFDSEKGKWILTRTAPMTVPTGTVTQANGTLCYIDRGILRMYDHTSRAWPMKSEFRPRHWVEATALGSGKLYLCGNTDGDDTAATVLELLDVKTGKYSVVDRITRGPTTRCIVALDECLYAIGGRNELGDACNLVERYNPDTALWTSLSPMLRERCFFGCATMNGKIYVCGGMKHNEFDTMSSSEVYDPQKDEWKYIAPLQTARSRCVLVAYDGVLYVAGGTTPLGEHNGVDDVFSMEIYNPEKDCWEYGPSLNRAYGLVHGAAIPATLQPSA